jgi:hypothetical protein
MRRVFAVFALTAGLITAGFVVVPAASADPVHVDVGFDADPGNDQQLCLKIYLSIRGNVIDPDDICIDY